MTGNIFAILLISCIIGGRLQASVKSDTAFIERPLTLPTPGGALYGTLTLPEGSGHGLSGKPSDNSPCPICVFPGVILF